MKYLQVLLVSILLCVNAFGALPATVVWEVRTAGSVNNGGGFVAGASGTDRSQSNSAFCSATDLTLPSTTTATSSTCPFSAASVGNLIHITAGSNCTTGFYQVVSVATVTATLDRAAGTTSCTAGTFALGGAVALPGTATNVSTSGNTIWVKADGTYTVTASANVNNTSTQSPGLKIIGYTTTRGDNGRPTWTTATNSTALIFSDTTAGLSVRNFNFSSTASTKANGIQMDFADDGLAVDNCLFDGFLNGINHQRGDSINTTISRVEIKNSTGDGLRIAANSGNQGGVVVFDSYFHNNAGSGINFSEVNGNITTVNVVSSKNTLDGVTIASQSGTSANIAGYFFNSVFSENTRDGIRYDGASVNEGILVAVNTILYGNTGIGWNTNIAPTFQQSLNNAFGNNGTDRTNITAGAADITLTSDPFTSKSTGDYSLNSTAGGGGALKGTGFPGVALFGTGGASVGAVDPTILGTTITPHYAVYTQ